MFKKLLREMIDATTKEQVIDILYRKDGVDRLYQIEKLNWTEHQLLFDLADVLDVMN